MPTAQAELDRLLQAKQRPVDTQTAGTARARHLTQAEIDELVAAKQEVSTTDEHGLTRIGGDSRLRAEEGIGRVGPVGQVAEREEIGQRGRIEGDAERWRRGLDERLAAAGYPVKPEQEAAQQAGVQRTAVREYLGGPVGRMAGAFTAGAFSSVIDAGLALNRIDRAIGLPEAFDEEKLREARAGVGDVAGVEPVAAKAGAGAMGLLQVALTGQAVGATGLAAKAGAAAARATGSATAGVLAASAAGSATTLGSMSALNETARQLAGGKRLVPSEIIKAGAGGVMFGTELGPIAALPLKAAIPLSGALFALPGVIDKRPAADIAVDAATGMLLTAAFHSPKQNRAMMNAATARFRQAARGKVRAQLDQRLRAMDVEIKRYSSSSSEDDKAFGRWLTGRRAALPKEAMSAVDKAVDAAMAKEFFGSGKARGGNVFDAIRVDRAAGRLRHLPETVWQKVGAEFTTKAQRARSQGMTKGRGLKEMTKAQAAMTKKGKVPTFKQAQQYDKKIGIANGAKYPDFMDIATVSRSWGEMFAVSPKSIYDWAVGHGYTVEDIEAAGRVVVVKVNGMLNNQTIEQSREAIAEVGRTGQEGIGQIGRRGPIEKGKKGLAEVVGRQRAEKKVGRVGPVGRVGQVKGPGVGEGAEPARDLRETDEFELEIPETAEELAADDLRAKKQAAEAATAEAARVEREKPRTVSGLAELHELARGAVAAEVGEYGRQERLERIDKLKPGTKSWVRKVTDALGDHNIVAPPGSELGKALQSPSLYKPELGRPTLANSWRAPFATDGHFLILDKEAAATWKKKHEARVQKALVASGESLEKAAKEPVPDIKRVVPKVADIRKKPLRAVATKVGWPAALAVYDIGDGTLLGLDPGLVGMMEKYLPGATLHAMKGEGAPLKAVAVRRDGKTVGLVMPISIDDRFDYLKKGLPGAKKGVRSEEGGGRIGPRTKKGEVGRVGPVGRVGQVAAPSPQPSPVKGEGAKKAAWEMTAREWFEERTMPKLVYEGKPAQRRANLAKKKTGVAAHRVAVAKALEAGEAVPAEVLKDYPDLVKKGGEEGIGQIGRRGPIEKGKKGLAEVVKGQRKGDIPPRPMVDARGTALKLDAQLQAQQAWDKKYGARVKAGEAVPVAKAKPRQTYAQKVRADLKRIRGVRYKTAANERQIARLEAKLKVKPDKWQVDQGVSWKPTPTQTNRGFRIVKVDRDNRQVVLRQVADTGLTVSGGDRDVIKDTRVDMVDLKRDKRYDKAKGLAEVVKEQRAEKKVGRVGPVGQVGQVKEGEPQATRIVPGEIEGVDRLVVDGVEHNVVSVEKGRVQVMSAGGKSDVLTFKDGQWVSKRSGTVADVSMKRAKGLKKGEVYSAVDLDAAMRSMSGEDARRFPIWVPTDADVQADLRRAIKEDLNEQDRYVALRAASGEAVAGDEAAAVAEKLADSVVRRAEDRRVEIARRLKGKNDGENVLGQLERKDISALVAGIVDHSLDAARTPEERAALANAQYIDLPSVAWNKVAAAYLRSVERIAVGGAAKPRDIIHEATHHALESVREGFLRDALVDGAAARKTSPIARDAVNIASSVVGGARPLTKDDWNQIYFRAVEKFDRKDMPTVFAALTSWAKGRLGADPESQWLFASEYWSHKAEQDPVVAQDIFRRAAAVREGLQAGMNPIVAMAKAAERGMWFKKRGITPNGDIGKTSVALDYLARGLGKAVSEVRDAATKQYGAPEGHEVDLPADAEDAVAKLLRIVKMAKPMRVELEQAYTAERGKRIGEFEKRLPGVKTLKDFERALGTLKGQLAEPPMFEPPEKQLTPREIRTLLRMATRNPNLTGFEKLNTLKALRTLLGGGLPGTRGLEQLQEVYGAALVKSAMGKRSLGAKAWDEFVGALNIPRTLMSTGELSGVLRQAAIATVTQPEKAAGSLAAALRFMFDTKAFEGYFSYDIKRDPMYRYARRSGLAITDPASAEAWRREEAFMSRTLQKVPGLGHYIRFWERGYTGYLNKMRFDTFKDWAEGFLAEGRNPEWTKGGKPVNEDAKVFNAAADVANTFTGRGDLGKRLNRLAPTLNTLLWSARLQAASIQTMSPLWYKRLPAPMQKKALAMVAKALAVGLSVAALAKTVGANVELNPLSSDFGTIRVGRTRFDIWAGRRQWVRVMAQVIAGKRKSIRTGRTSVLSRKKFPWTTRKDVAQRFVEGKLAPAIAGGLAVLEGQTYMGEPLSVEGAAWQNFTPMYVQDIVDAYQNGGLDEALIAGGAGFWGVGIYTVPPRKPKAAKGMKLGGVGDLRF